MSSNSGRGRPAAKVTCTRRLGHAPLGHIEKTTAPGPSVTGASSASPRLLPRFSPPISSIHTKLTQISSINPTTSKIGCRPVTDRRGNLKVEEGAQRRPNPVAALGALSRWLVVKIDEPIGEFVCSFKQLKIQTILFRMAQPDRRISKRTHSRPQSHQSEVYISPVRRGRPRR